ncbi:MerR family transcriptional regulator [Enterococcus florum]|uniref:MerR family transcriptional regulator n=1 Tax=Enterococcus florum TaxID=2480627 RepID=A0A4P5PFK1_9ENTE|nr:MerR family transcriptional regulator [Enterococcus florum]GCF95028.1 MerR family transcriptional regulator [Enterococcus florum]
MYTIKQLAELSGVTTRTLRYYDQIGLLEPSTFSAVGYRLYRQPEVERLQQILLYRSMDLPLKEIKQILDQPDFDLEQTLLEQYQRLVSKRQTIDDLLVTIQQTLAHHKGEITMSNQEKFEAFKRQAMAENEQQYGKVLRETYDLQTIDASNQKWASLTEMEYQTMQEAEEELLESLRVYLAQPELLSKEAQAVFQAHQAWLKYSLETLTPEMHRGLGEMYVADERFTSYYDERAGVGAAKALRAIIFHYAE